MRAMQTIEQKKAEYEEICKQLERMDKNESGSYTAQVAKSFHLGRVGGSGRNTHRLNKRREREIDRTVDNAVKYCALVKRRDDLKREIEYIESGQKEKDEQRRANREQGLADAWHRLKPGDELPMGNGTIVIKKKNAKSIVDTHEIKWSAAEIIGSKAASLL